MLENLSPEIKLELLQILKAKKKEKTDLEKLAEKMPEDMQDEVIKLIEEGNNPEGKTEEETLGDIINQIM
jgi:hypothetical protein